MKESIIKAGDSLVVVRRQFSSVPMDYHFSARPAAGEGEPAGIIEISRKKTFSSPPAETRPLKYDNVVSAGFTDTFVTVTVHAESDLIVSSNRLPGRSIMPILLIALGIVALAGAMVLLLS